MAEKTLEFSIDKDTAVTYFGLVNTAVAAKTTTPILRTIYIEGDIERQRLKLRATDTLVDITAYVPATVISGGSVCVDHLITDTINAFNKGEIHVKQGNRLIITQGGKKHMPSYVPPEKFPAALYIPEEAYIDADPERLIGILSRASIGIAKLPDRPVLTSYHINPHLNYVATGDGKQITLYNEPVLSIKNDAPSGLAGNIANPIAKIVDQYFSTFKGVSDSEKYIFQVAFGVNGANVAFRALDKGTRVPLWTIITNGYNDPYPTKPRDYIIEALNNKPKFMFTISKSEFEPLLKTCKMYSDRAYDEGKSDHTVLTFENGQLYLRMAVPDLVEMEEPVPAAFEDEYTSAELDYWFMAEFLLEAVAAAEGPTLTLRFYGNTAPMLMVDSAAPNFTYLQMAMSKGKNQ